MGATVKKKQAVLWVAVNRRNALGGISRLDHTQYPVRDALSNRAASHRTAVIDVALYSLSRGEIALRDCAALGAAELGREPLRQTIAEVHGLVERVDIVGKRIAAYGHQPDHVQDAEMTGLDLAEQQAERHYASGERTAGHPGEECPAHEP